MTSPFASLWQNTTALARDPVRVPPVDIPAIVLEAEAALEGMRPRLAIEILWRAVEAAPAIPELRYNLGFAQQVAGLSAAAAASYRTALILEPNSLAAMRGLTSALEELGQWREAESLRSVAGLTLPIIHRAPGAADDVVGLTIDDGPSPDSTLVLLDVLKHADARASFFVVGWRAQQHPHLVDAILEAGHDVLSHGYSHRPLGDGRFDLCEEFEAAETVLARHRPTPSPNWIRLPFGNGCESPDVHRRLLAWNAGTVLVQWMRSFYEWAFVSTCKNQDEVRRACRAAVREGMTVPPPSGTIFMTHDHPFGSTEPLAAYASVVLVEELLRELAARNLRAESLSRILKPHQPRQ